MNKYEQTSLVSQCSECILYSLHVCIVCIPLVYSWFASLFDYHGSFFLIVVSIIIGQSMKVFMSYFFY